MKIVLLKYHEMFLIFCAARALLLSMIYFFKKKKEIINKIIFFNRRNFNFLWEDKNTKYLSLSLSMWKRKFAELKISSLHKQVPSIF